MISNSVLWFAASLMLALVMLREGVLSGISRGEGIWYDSCAERMAPLSKSLPLVNISGATGQRFHGEEVREFPRELLKHNHLSLRHQAKGNQTGLMPQMNPQRNCGNWVVITTIYKPSEAVILVADLLTKNYWCVVIVADTITPTNYLSLLESQLRAVQDDDTAKEDIIKERIVFLSVPEQKKLAEKLPFAARMPFQSFARKNIGYLYAIWNQAQVVLDLDDDNILIRAGGQELLKHYSNGVGRINDKTLHVQTVRMDKSYQNKAMNPFPLMGPSISGTWPRGLPLTVVQAEEAHGQGDAVRLLQYPNIGIIQSVCNHDPDVDAIYRLTRQLPVDFSRSSRPLMIPSNLYTPYNAQATLHYPATHWGMYLPMTVTGRVSDIWRSYIVQRLLRELETPLRILYSPPWVIQIRNAHDYLEDMAAEQHLYMRTETLLDYLDSWQASSEATTLPQRILELWPALYERNYVEVDDVLAIKEWLDALQQGGYMFPKVI
jgi:hypothetical protein